MSHSTEPKTWVRVVNGLAALMVAAAVLGSYLPIVKVFELTLCDLGLQGEWIGGHARRITGVTPGGPADDAGLRLGDVLEFDPSRNDDWVLAGYRNMPVGFTGTLPVRHADGSRETVTFAPEPVPYLNGIGDRVALVVRLTSLSMLVLLSVAVVWARPGIMTWSLFFGAISGAPVRIWVPFYLAFLAGPHTSLQALFATSLWCWVIALVPFALCFPRDYLVGWRRWQQWLAFVLALAAVSAVTASLYPQPFERELAGNRMAAVLGVVVTMSAVAAVAALARTYRRSSHEDQARLKWAMFGISTGWLSMSFSFLYVVLRLIKPYSLTGSEVTPHHWISSFSYFVILLSLGYAVLRQRVVDIQFAISRTLVYGVVSTIVLVFLAVLHWLLGRMIEHSRFAFGLEGLAAVGLGLVLHRASHGINTTVDRVLFRKHHAAEERLRQVTAALPFASTEQSIAQAIVVEPTRNLELASAALFYREGSDGPLRRVLAVGWVDSHAASLDAESLLVRYLQAEHSALRLTDEQEWLPAGMPDGAAHPVLAIPIVTQHVLTAVVLYGAHVNSTLPDPDEIVLLEALAKAAATSHQQVRIAMLMREKIEAEREAELQRARNEQLEATLHVFARERT